MRINENFLFEELEEVSKEPPFVVSDMNGEHRVICLTEEPEISSYLYREEIIPKEIYTLNKWLRQHREDYVRLYHGTSAKISVKEQGLLTTSMKRRRSYQSESGYVYLSLYPSSARTFGEMGYPYDDVVVYAVDVKIKELRPDTDQLYNKRMYMNEEIGNTLADSLIFGHGARIKRALKPWEIKLTDY